MNTKSSAFSLVEMIVVLVLAALLIGMTAPHFKGFFSARELQNAVTFIENSIEEAYSQARSEQQIVGLEFKVREVEKFTCDFAVAPGTQIITGCIAGTRVTENLLWEGRDIGESLKVTLNSPFTLYLTPPHGDIIDPDSSFIGGEKSLEITHNKSLDLETIKIHKLSGLVEIQ